MDERRKTRAWRCLFAALLLTSAAVWAGDSFPAGTYQKAVDLFEQGKLAEAEEVLRPELGRHPRAPEALGLLAAILDGEKRYDEAERYYNRALELAPNSPSLLNNLGNHYLERNLPDRARTMFLRVIALEPNHPNANLQLAKMSVAAKRGEKALRYLGDLPASDQTKPAVELLRARALAYAGQRAAADRLLSQVQKQASGTPGLDYSAGILLAELGRYPEAEEAFARALHEAPANFDILYNLGLAAERAGDLDRATEVFETALRQLPNDPDCLFNLANVFTAKSRPDQAAVLLLQAHNAVPERPDILYALAKTSEQMGFYADAASAMDQYLKLKLHDDIARRERGFCYARSGDLERGLRDLRWYTQSYPKDPRGFYEMGIAESARDTDKALEHMTRALELDPKMTAARYARAVLYYQEGKSAESMKDLHQALEAEPDNPLALDLLGLNYLRLDRGTEAAKVLAWATKLRPKDPKILMHYSRALLHEGRREEAEKLIAQFKALGPEASGRRPHGGLFEFLTLPPVEQLSRYVANLQRTMDTRPEDPDLEVRLGKALLYQGRVQEAVEVFRAVHQQTSDPGILAACGKSLLDWEQYAAAREFLQSAVAADPSNTDLRIDLTIAVFHSEGPQAGLRVLDTTPPSERKGDYFLARAQILDALNKPQEAAEALNRGFQAAPTRTDLYFEAALFLIKRGQLQHAADLLQEEVTIAPNVPELQLTEAIAYALLQQHDTAQDLLAKMEARWPEWNLPYLVHGIILTIRLRSGQAKDLLETAIALGADDALAYYYLALALITSDPIANLQQAQEAIGKALKLDSQNAFCQSLAGKIAYLQKDYPRAEAHLLTALRLWPDMVEAHQTLSGVYRAEGDKQKSIVQLEEVVRIKQENRSADQSPPFPTDLLFTMRPAFRATM